MRTKPYNFDLNANQYWFTGCTHVFHNQPFIWEKRGHKSIEAHAEFVQAKINELVQPNDILFHLGDGFLNSTPEQVKEWLTGLKCRRIYYITGNHESSMSQLYRAAKQDLGVREGYEIYPVSYLNVTFVGPMIQIKVRNTMTLTHFPMAIWDKSHHGTWNIHSHCHATFPESLPYHGVGKRLDVGWDVFNRPISLPELNEIMERKRVEIRDHHNSQTT